MLKSILTYIAVFTALLFGGQYAHTFFLEYSEKVLSYAINTIYLFHFFFSLTICTVFIVLGQKEKFKDQLGFLYLATILLKIVFFAILFRNLIFNETLMSSVERISLLVPVVLFLSFEVFFISKIFRQL